MPWSFHLYALVSGVERGASRHEEVELSSKTSYHVMEENNSAVEADTRTVASTNAIGAPALGA